MANKQDWQRLAKTFRRLGDELGDACENAAENADVPGMGKIYDEYRILADTMGGDRKHLNRQAKKILDKHYARGETADG